MVLLTTQALWYWQGQKIHFYREGISRSLAIKGSPKMKHFDKYYAEIKLALCIKIKNITLFDFKFQHL